MPRLHRRVLFRGEDAASTEVLGSKCIKLVSGLMIFMRKVQICRSQLFGDRLDTSLALADCMPLSVDIFFVLVEFPFLRLES